MKNKLVNYLATGALVAGSLLPLGCGKRNLEGKLNQPGVQAVQNTTQAYEDPVLARVMGKLRQEYEKFDVSQLSGEERRMLEDEMKKCPGLISQDKNNIYEGGYLDPQRSLEIYKKYGFINVNSPTMKDLAFTRLFNNYLNDYLSYNDYLKENPSEIDHTLEIGRTLKESQINTDTIIEIVKKFQKKNGKNKKMELEDFDELLNSSFMKRFEGGYNQFPVNLKNKASKTWANLAEEANRRFFNAWYYAENKDSKIWKDMEQKGVYSRTSFCFYEILNRLSEEGVVNPSKLTEKDFAYIISERYQFFK